MSNLVLTCIVLTFSTLYGLLHTQVAKITPRHSNAVSLPIFIIACLMFPILPLTLVCCGVVMGVCVALTLKPGIPVDQTLLCSEGDGTTSDCGLVQMCKHGVTGACMWCEDEQVGNMDQLADLG